MADGEPVIDVPAKLSARVRLFSTGQDRKTDPVDAHSVALVGLRSAGLRAIGADDATVALRLLIDRCDELGVIRTQTVNRILRLLLELLPGGADKHLSAAQAKTLLATVRPRDVVGRTRRRLATEHIAETITISIRGYRNPAGRSVRPRRGAVVDSIVVGQGHASESGGLLRFAEAEAARRDLPIEIVHVWNASVEVSVDLLDSLDSGVVVTASAVAGPGATALMCWRPELLVLGHDSFSSHHLSSTIRACLHQLGCPW